MERSLYWYIGSLHILTNTCTTSLTTKQVAMKVLYSIITNKDDLHKENIRIKQVLKENGYQESIFNKIFEFNLQDKIFLILVNKLISLLLILNLLSTIIQYTKPQLKNLLESSYIFKYIFRVCLIRLTKI